MPAAVDSRLRPVLGLVGLVAVSALALTGCSAGQQAQTVEQTSVVDGVGFQAGAIQMRDVGLRAPSGPSYAEGDNAYLEGIMINNGDSDDRLVSVSSPAAGQVLLFTDGVSALLGVAPTPSGSTTATAGATGSAGASATATATGTPSEGSTPTTSSSPTGSATATSAAAAPDALTDVALPAGDSLQFGYSNQQLSIVFVGLTKALFPAQSLPVTFTFANGGTATATISVKLKVDQTLDAPTIDTGEQGE